MEMVADNIRIYNKQSLRIDRLWSSILGDCVEMNEATFLQNNGNLLLITRRYIPKELNPNIDVMASQLG
jgi:hypothetical protein